MIQTNLQFYKQDNGIYPNCPSNQQKCLVTETEPFKIGFGSIGDYFYTPLGSSYQIDFELTKNIAEFMAGKNCAIPNEIINMSCDEIGLMLTQ